MPELSPTAHAGVIPEQSLRAWKFLLMALNEAFDRKSADLLLAIEQVGPLDMSGDGIAVSAALIASDKGKKFIQAWKNGDPTRAVDISAT